MDDFFECPWVWMASLCVAAAVLLARCDVPEGFDPYEWQGVTPDADCAACYERDMVADSLPPCGE